jgi:class 3 adenylate cyclase
MEAKRHTTLTLRTLVAERFSVLRPKTWKHVSMVTQMIGVTVTLLLGAIATSGTAAYLVSKSQLETEIAFTGEQLVTSLAGSITTVIGKEGSEADLQVGLNKLMVRDEGNRILDANILGKDFTILASKDPQRIRIPYTGPIRLNELNTLKTFRGKENSTLIATPVLWGKGDNVRTLGFVVMEFSNAPIERAKRQTVLWFTLIFVLAVTATTLLTRLVMGRLLKPIVELGKASRALAQGDSEYRLEEPQGHDEIALAIGSFLTMREIQQVLFKFSNPALVRLILKGRAPDKAEEVKLTVGFGDGVKFTDWSAKNPAPVIAEMLTDYFTLAGRMVDHFEGIVEKFIGDAVMSYFGLEAKESLELYAQNAIKAKLCVQQSFQIAHWAFRHYQGRKPLEFRFGIATGPCVVGPIGAKGVKLDYTLIGSTVNLAARLEGIAAPGGLAVDKFTYLNARDGGLALLTSEPRQVEVKGFKDPILVHSIIGLEDPAEDEKLRQFLRDFFAQADTLSIFRLTPEQLPEFKAEVEKRLSAPIRLPVPGP